jgi:hypothetical protein
VRFGKPSGEVRGTGRENQNGDTVLFDTSFYSVYIDRNGKGNDTSEARIPFQMRVTIAKTFRRGLISIHKDDRETIEKKKIALPQRPNTCHLQPIQLDKQLSSSIYMCLTAFVPCIAFSRRKHDMPGVT